MYSFIPPQYIQPAAIGLGVTVLVVIAFFLLNRKSRSHQTKPTDLLSLSRSSDWELPQTSFANRRGSVRREGAPVKVLLSSPSFHNGVSTGYVVDRSTGGLRIAMKSGMPPGGTMLVRTTNAPDTTPWVTVIVRSCRENGKHYELGCEFDKTPPWSVLLLFG